MENVSRAFSGDNSEADDIDKLFSHLEQFDPPADMVGRIMDAVNHLPLPGQEPGFLEEEPEEPVVNQLHKQPS